MAESGKFENPEFNDDYYSPTNEQENDSFADSSLNQSEIEVSYVGQRPNWARDTVPLGLTEETQASAEALTKRINDFKSYHKIDKDISTFEFSGDKKGKLWVRWVEIGCC